MALNTLIKCSMAGHIYQIARILSTFPCLCEGNVSGRAFRLEFESIESMSVVTM